MKLSQEPCRHGRYPWHAFYTLYITGLGRVSWPNGYEWVCHNGMMHVALLWWMCARWVWTLYITWQSKTGTRIWLKTSQTPFHLSFKGKSRASSVLRSWWGKTQVQVNQFLHSYACPSQAYLILKRCTLHACLSGNCQSRFQESWWTILSATDDRWRGMRGAGWVHVKGSAGEGLLWRCYGDKVEGEVVYDGRWWVVHTRR